MADKAVHKLLVLDDAQMVALLGNAQIVQAFPFLSLMAKATAAATTKSGCGSCNGGKPSPDYSGIRAAIGSMSKESQARFKELVGAERVRVYYQNHSKQMEKVTF